jgi:hypothetical protein
MYGITQDTQDTSLNSPIPLGINQNVSFKGATFEKLSDDKEPVLQYHFEDSENRTLTHTIWPVDAQRVRDNTLAYPKEHRRTNKAKGYVKGNTITPNEAVEIAGADFNAYNYHILNRFFTQEQILKAMEKVNSYATFAQAIVSLTDTTSNFPLVRLKVVLSYNDKYHVLPKNHYEPFIELMSVTPSALKITQYDKIERSTPTGDNPEAAAFEINDFPDDDDLAF